MRLNRHQLVAAGPRPSRSVSIAVLITITVALTACGPKHDNVFAVKRGMTKQEVRATACAPSRTGRHCWLYHAKKHGTSIEGMRICFTDGRVSLKQISMHL
jgi:hypothetical protein